MHRRTLAGLALAPALAVGLAASPASAAQQEGLVNVNITDVTVQVPIGVTLNVCDVTVGVLVGTIDDAAAPCNAAGGTIALESPDTGGGGGSQRGLINVNLQDVTAQVPIAIAANICDVNVAVLVNELIDDATTCQAGAVSVAR